jgi:hypothetical protein
MKKITLLAVAALAMTFASCKKDYTCECTSTTAGISATASTTINETKKKATDACEKGTTSTTVLGITSSTTCKIK